MPETYGVQIHKDIKPLETESIILKHYPNSFHKTILHEELVRNEITDLIVCGMMTHICIDTTIRSAKDFGYNIALISDGCATKDLEWNGVHITAETIQNVYMASLNQKFANVITCAQFLQS